MKWANPPRRLALEQKVDPWVAMPTKPITVRPARKWGMRTQGTVCGAAGMLLGIVVGIIGIVVLLMLIPLTKGPK